MRRIPVALFAFALFTLLGVSSLAFALNIPNDEAGVQVDMPDDWQGTYQEDTLIIFAPDQNNFLVFRIAEATDLEEVLGGIDQHISPLFASYSYTVTVDPHWINLNGMDGINTGIGGNNKQSTNK